MDWTSLVVLAGLNAGGPLPNSKSKIKLRILSYAPDCD